MRLLYWVVGLLLAVLFLAAQAPAWLLAKPLQRATGERVSLANERGSLWQGEADANVQTARGKTLALGRVSWVVNKHQLLLGKLGVSLELTGTEASGRLLLTTGLSRALRLAEVSMLVPAHWLSEFAPATDFFKPEGTLTLTADTLAIDADKIDGALRIVWRDLATVLAKVRPLGSYRVDAKSDGGAFPFQLATEQGALLLEGRGTWSLNGGVNFSGTARAQPGREAELADLLAIMGRAQGDGSYLLSLRYPRPRP